MAANNPVALGIFCFHLCYSISGFWLHLSPCNSVYFTLNMLTRSISVQKLSHMHWNASGIRDVAREQADDFIYTVLCGESSDSGNMWMCLKSIFVYSLLRAGEEPSELPKEQVLHMESVPWLGTRQGFCWVGMGASPTLISRSSMGLGWQDSRGREKS